MTHHDHDERPVDRRLLLRGGAVLAGAAGVTVVGAALGPSAAQAADNSPLLAGKANAADNTTVLTIDGTAGGPAPALSLVNKNGPGLRLSSVPDTYNETLAVGDLAGSDLGPLVGVNYGDGPESTYLLTANDLAYIPVPLALASPIRLLDTRTPAGRAGIVLKSSTTATDSAGRLTAGSWIDVFVADAGKDDDLSGLFVNLTVVSPVSGGFSAIYSGGARPNTSTINFQASVNLANGAFVAPAVYNGDFVVRIFTSGTTHVLLDLTGKVASTMGQPAALSASSGATRRAARQTKRASALKEKLTRSVG